MKKRIGILTGGGDAPGLNAAIRAVVKKLLKLNSEIIGIKDGWKGLLENQTTKLTEMKTSGIIDRGGTILGTSRTNPFKIKDGPQTILNNFKKMRLDALIAIGGEDTLGAAAKLYKMGLPVVGIPKTIDNDVAETDYTIGFQTAVETATEALDKLRSTAESHHRVMILEVMGRYTGWIAVYAGLAAGADAILIPEISIDINKLCGMIKKRYKAGRHFTIIVVAEGAKFGEEFFADEEKDAFGHPLLRKRKVGERLEKIIQEKTGFDVRSSCLSHIQRGGSPVAYDRNLATSFGVKAVELIEQGRFGEMVAIKGRRIVSVPLEKAVEKRKTVDLNIYKIAETFFG